MTIIDGQQRLSTFILLFVALHNRLACCRGTINGSKTEVDQWLRDEVEKLMADLRDCFILDKRSGHRLHRYYPRLIRSFVDVWSTKPEGARYDGAMARLIWRYLEHIEDDKTVSKAFAAPGVSGPGTDSSANVERVFRHIVSRVRKLPKAQAEDIDLVDHAFTEGFDDALLGYEIPADVRTRLQAEGTAKADRDFREAFAALIFGHYVQNRMAFTAVETGSEDDAFDMFEALNTTGEPLTAFETFRPRVIEAEALEAYEASPSRAQVARVERYLDRFATKTQKLQGATSDLLVAFALAEMGEKLGKKLNEQRRYLRREYGDPGNPEQQEERRDFVGRLGDVADFANYYWDPEPEAGAFFAGLPAIGNEARVALEFLRALNHTVTIAPLARFFGAALQAKVPEERQRAMTDFEGALRATAAFSAIWRGTYGATSGIDTIYRDVMNRGDHEVALAAHPTSGLLGAVDIAAYKTALSTALEEKSLTDAAAWAERVVSVPIAAKSRPTAQFLLTAAAHDATEDGDTGLVEAGRAGLHTMLTPQRWAEIAGMEVEHVAPKQAQPGSWDARLYDDPDLIDTLGNLTLLPKRQNIVVSNHPWRRSGRATARSRPGLRRSSRPRERRPPS